MKSGFYLLLLTLVFFSCNNNLHEEEANFTDNDTLGKAPVVKIDTTISLEKKLDTIIANNLKFSLKHLEYIYNYNLYSDKRIFEAYLKKFNFFLKNDSVSSDSKIYYFDSTKSEYKMFF